MEIMGDSKRYRISGHEKFPCRYSWLPKAVRGVSENPNLFSNHNEDAAMVHLGLGKKMVRNVRPHEQALTCVRGGVMDSRRGQSDSSGPHAHHLR